MSVLVKDVIFLKRYIRNLRGGSQPILAQASDGHIYVVKFANNLQGPNLLFNESVGSELYRTCGLPVPAWRPLKVTKDFLDKNRDCWMQTPEGRLRPASGLCFGSRYLGENDKRILEILPSTSFTRVRNSRDFWLAWLIDICAEHVDNRQAVFVEDAVGQLDAYFVDFGHFFSGPKGDRAKNFRASRYLDTRIYGAVALETLLQFKNVARAWETDAFWQRLQAIPVDWRQASAVASFERCLQRLVDPSLVQSVLDTIADDIRQPRESGAPANGRQPENEILRFGVRRAGFGERYNYHPACA